MKMKRDYASIVGKVRESTAGLGIEDRMQAVVDLLWDAFGTKGYSWCGFYLPGPDRDELILGPRRNKPACSPISLEGVCGKCFVDKKALVVRDVAELGRNYIACDPRDKSEAVVPVFDEAGEVLAVLDVDSYEVGEFGRSDIEGLKTILATAGIGRCV